MGYCLQCPKVAKGAIRSGVGHVKGRLFVAKPIRELDEQSMKDLIG